MKILSRYPWCLLLGLAFSAVGVAQELQDPTKPSYYQGDSGIIRDLQQNYQLSSIILSNNRRFAIINGVRVEEGDEVGEAAVSKIMQAGVRLVVRDIAFTVNLVEHDIKRP